MWAHVRDNVPELTGGFWPYLAKNRTPAGSVAMPFAVYEKGTGADSSYESSGDGLERGDFTVSVYAADDGDADDIALAIAATLKDADLLFDSGVLAYLRPVGVFDSTLEDDPGPGGVDVYRSTIRLRYIIETQS